MSFLYILLAILGLSFLIFIHELGHYYMARRLGMRVETFSIGFGKPIYSWVRDGVQWQIGWLLFGGYVKITGMDASDTTKNPYEIKDGFFGKGPLDRIKVAAMGPIVNIVFALLVFAALWFMGGRDKNFSDYTRKIGWIDPKSELYAKGVRPGDEIVAYGSNEFDGAKDHLYAPMTAHGGHVEVKGYKVDLFSKDKVPFDYRVNTYPHPAAMDKDLLTAGILQPASYVIYDRLPNGNENPLPEGSPMSHSGIQYGDRIVWVDGEAIYSVKQLNHLLNDSRVLATVQRGQDIILRRVPRVKIEELKLDGEVKEELIDWQFEARLNGKKFQQLYALPYNMNNHGVIEERLKFIDKENEEEAFPANPFSPLESPLQKGDRILAIDGMSIAHSFEILANLQQRHVSIVVQRDSQINDVTNWKDADGMFDKQFSWRDLQALISHIGISSYPLASNNLYLLEPVVPKPRSEFKVSDENQALATTERQAQRKELEKIEDPDKRAHALSTFDSQDKQLLIGLPLQDKKVQYNPNPFTMFSAIMEDIWRTLSALFTGSLNPKWMSGPVGIVQVAYDSSMVSLKEAFFLLGTISLNLGILNLLPLPVLDGGMICFCLYELITGRRLKSKTMEKLIIPFAVLLIGFFIFLTYHDVTRLLKNFFH